MTVGKPSKSYFFLACIPEILLGILFYFFCPPTVSESVRLWLTLVTTLLATLLAIILSFIALFQALESKLSDKAISRAISFIIIGSYVFWLLFKIFVIDEFYNGSKSMLWYTTLFIVWFNVEEFIYYLMFMNIKTRQFENSIRTSSNIDNPNVKIRIPGRACAIWSFILSFSFLSLLTGLLSVLYRYPSMFKTINKLYYYVPSEGWDYIKINGLLYIVLWLSSAILGLSVYLGNKAKKKGFDCGIASTGTSLGIAGLTIALVLASLSQIA